MKGSITTLNGIRVIVSNTTYTKKRDFKWKYKWYQRPFNLFKKYKLIHAEKENCWLVPNNKSFFMKEQKSVLVNPITYEKLKGDVR